MSFFQLANIHRKPLHTGEITSQPEKKNRKSSAIFHVLYKILTGLLLVAFVGAILFFLISPFSHDIFQFKLNLKRFSPYNIAYNFTVPVMMKLKSSNIAEPTTEQVQKEDSIENVSSDVETANLEAKGTYLQIDSIEVYGQVVDGTSQDSMFRGFWHFPLSSTPGKRGNTVIFGHRFDRYPPDPQTFFNLDKIVVGDKVKIIQKDDSIDYTVVQIKVVEKNDKSVLQDFGDYRLTLITCTPLWTSEQRLVIIAIQDRVANRA